MRALLLVDHGSRRADANETLEQMSALLRERLGGAQAEVRVAFAHMELASPSLPEAFESLAEAGATQIVIVPYMLTPGRHAIEDIPRIAAECAARHPGLRHRVAPPLGVHPGLAAAVLDRAALELPEP